MVIAIPNCAKQVLETVKTSKASNKKRSAMVRMLFLRLLGTFQKSDHRGGGGGPQPHQGSQPQPQPGPHQNGSQKPNPIGKPNPKKKRSRKKKLLLKKKLLRKKKLFTKRRFSKGDRNRLEPKRLNPNAVRLNP